MTGKTGVRGASRAGAGDLPKGALGPLETDIMNVVWDRSDVTTRDVHEELLRHRDIAYTTVMTVMGNLTRKGLLERRLEGKAYLYRAARTRAEVTRSQVAKIIDPLLDRFAQPAFSHLISRLGTLDEERLAELEAEVARLRQEGIERDEGR